MVSKKRRLPYTTRGQSKTSLVEPMKGRESRFVVVGPSVGSRPGRRFSEYGSRSQVVTETRRETRHTPYVSLALSFQPTTRVLREDLLEYDHPFFGLHAPFTSRSTGVSVGRLESLSVDCLRFLFHFTGSFPDPTSHPQNPGHQSLLGTSSQTRTPDPLISGSETPTLPSSCLSSSCRRLRVFPSTLPPLRTFPVPV